MPLQNQQMTVPSRGGSVKMHVKIQCLNPVLDVQFHTRVKVRLGVFSTV